MAQYGFVQVAARLVPGEVCVPFPNGTRLLVSPRMKGAAHFIAPRLCEFAEMAFVMHFLRSSDLFADVGANIGAYTILAAGVAGAEACALEPSPDTFELLTRNVRLNGLEHRVRTVNAAVGRQPGTISFSRGMGTENCVRPNASTGSLAVRLTTLDGEFAVRCPDVMKVDVEGYEAEVLAGAGSTLRSPQLRAMIVERSGIGSRYGFDEESLHRTIRELGFVPCVYDAFARRLAAVGSEARGNIIYVRDLARAGEILKATAPFHLDDLTV